MSKSRYEYNKEILKLLEEYLEQCPDLRFVQLLWGMGIISDKDDFYTESKTTYDTLLKNLKKK